MQRNNLIALMAVAALGAPSVGRSVALQPGFGLASAAVPRRSAYRKGRRFDDRGRPVDRNGHRPAGSKLAKQAARGQLTINRIR